MSKKELTIKAVFASLLIGAGFACGFILPRRAGCPKIEIKTSFQDGKLHSVYSYYRDAAGREVLHGERDVWQSENMKLVELYTDGVKVSSSWVSINY